MQQILIYVPPNDVPIDNARLEDIVGVVLTTNSSYWSPGPAEIYLGQHGGNAPHFILMYTKNGFYIEAAFVENLNGKLKFVSYTPDANLGRTEVDQPWAGQNPMRIPRDFCLSREKCAEAVRYFCETGDRDPSVNWVTKRSTGWDFTLDS